MYGTFTEKVSRQRSCAAGVYSAPAPRALHTISHGYLRLMNETSWAALGLTTEVLTELYRRGKEYAERRIKPGYREDAIQDGMLEVLKEVASPSQNYPANSEERLKYLTKTLYNAAMKHVTRKTPPDTNIPIE